jgi:hypothetical protein
MRIGQLNETGFVMRGFVVQPNQYLSQWRIDLTNGIHLLILCLAIQKNSSQQE